MKHRVWTFRKLLEKEIQTPMLAQSVWSPGVRDKILQVEKTFPKLKELSKKFGEKPRMGWFVFGPPGSGKTALTQALAGQLGLDLMVLPSHEIIDIENLTRALFEISQFKNQVIVLEDIDFLFTKLEPAPLLSLLDEAMEASENAFWIATTRHADQAPKSKLIRPGRFDDAIRTQNPNAMLRQFILTEAYKILNPNEEEPQFLADWIEKSEGLSFSHLKEMLRLMIKIYSEDRSDQIAVEMNSYLEEQFISRERWGEGEYSDAKDELSDRVKNVDPRMLLAGLDMTQIFRRVIDKALSDLAEAEANQSDMKAGR